MFIGIISWLICFVGICILLHIPIMLKKYKKYCKELVNKYFNENLLYEEFEIIRREYLSHYIEEYEDIYNKDGYIVQYAINTFFGKIALRIIKYSDAKLSTKDFVIKYVA